MGVILPTVQTAGIDLIWFGIFVVLVVEMAQITPPVGFNLFVLQGMTEREIGWIARVTLPFFFLMVLARRADLRSSRRSSPGCRGRCCPADAARRSARRRSWRPMPVHFDRKPRRRPADIIAQRSRRRAAIPRARPAAARKRRCPTCPTPPLSLLPLDEPRRFAWPTPDVRRLSGTGADAGAAGLRRRRRSTATRSKAGCRCSTRPQARLLLQHDARRATRCRCASTSSAACGCASPLAPLADGQGTGGVHGAAAAARRSASDAATARRSGEGQTIGHREEPFGLFLFEPVDDERHACSAGSCRASAYDARRDRTAHRRGAGRAATPRRPTQIDEALAEQQALRARKLGDILVARPDHHRRGTGRARSTQQARMPMVRIGEALTALGFITEAQLDLALVAAARATAACRWASCWCARAGLARRPADRAGAQDGLPAGRRAAVPARHRRRGAAAATRWRARLPALPLMMRAGRLVVAVEDPSQPQADRRDRVRRAVQGGAGAGARRRAAGTRSTAPTRRSASRVRRSAMQRRRAPASTSSPATPSKLLASMEMVSSRADRATTTSDSIEQSDNSLVRLINSMIIEAHSAGRLRHPHRMPAGPREGAHPLPQGRPAAALPGAAAHLPQRADRAAEDHVRPRHQRAPQAAGRQDQLRQVRARACSSNCAWRRSRPPDNLEDAVLRLLARRKPMPLDKLGLSPDNLRTLEDRRRSARTACCCASGPTGSGKTTTLHSVLGDINTPERKIWTAEDPVEITQAGLRQVQVNPKIDWTFAKALRAFLRADPDVIMVGEIRDQRDRADRDRGLADRPPGAVDAAHQQRARDRHAAARHGHGPVQLRRRAARRARAAAGAAAVRRVPRRHAGDARRRPTSC